MADWRAKEKAEFEELEALLLADSDVEPEIKNIPLRGYTSIDVLPELTGVPWCNLALAFIASLRPCGIRVSRDGSVTTDAWPWRVTVLLAEDGTIERIYQEVQIGYGCGHDVHKVLDRVKAAALV